MKLSNKAFAFLCVGIVVGAMILVYAVGRDWRTTKTRSLADTKKPAPPIRELELDNRFGDEPTVMVGGIPRPERDVREPASIPVPEQKISNVGRSPVVDPQANPNTASVAEALREGTHPERVSVMIEPAPFDRVAFENDPQSYLDIVEPGRVFQAAPAGPEVTPIRESGYQYFQILQGESVKLQATSEPNMPVTFYSAKLGQFDNQLTAITLRADADGLVSTTFKATPGTRGEIDIIASSPANSGFAKYIVDVELPKTDDAQ